MSGANGYYEHITLSDKHRAYLKNLISKISLSTKMYKRDIALLELDRGSTFTNVAQIVGVSLIVERMQKGLKIN